MKKVTIYRTTQGREFENEKVAELAERIEENYLSSDSPFWMVKLDEGFKVYLDSTTQIEARLIDEKIAIRIYFEVEKLHWKSKMVFDAFDKGLLVYSDSEFLYFEYAEPTLTSYDQFTSFIRKSDDIAKIFKLD